MERSVRITIAGGRLSDCLTMHRTAVESTDRVIPMDGFLVFTKEAQLAESCMRYGVRSQK
jgi:hypothetical protein